MEEALTDVEAMTLLQAQANGTELQRQPIIVPKAVFTILVVRDACCLNAFQAYCWRLRYVARELLGAGRKPWARTRASARTRSVLDAVQW